MRPQLLAATIAAFALGALLRAQAPGGVSGGDDPARWARSRTSFAEATRAIETWPASLPDALRGLSRPELERRWPGWLRERDAGIRRRIAQGDEDSVVNLWLYGTSFTTLPRAVGPDMSRAAGLTPRAIVSGRLDDLIDGIARPGSNDRLQFARQVVERRGLNPSSDEDRPRIRDFLTQARARMIAEFQEYDRGLRSAAQSGDPSDVLSTHAVLFRERGLSTDTSVLVTYAVDQALGAMAASGAIEPRALRHVAIVGPGLELTNKADGQDFYPQQTLQPFALMDSILSRSLAEPRQMRVTTFDVSPRVNGHIAAARERATRGQPYAIYLTLAADERWRPALLSFVARLGGRIGEPAEAPAVPPAAGAMTIRGVRVRPQDVLAIRAADLNVVVERSTPPRPEDRLDLIVATNVLVYYGRFEQALALTNLAAMLRPGGILLTNSAVFPLPPFKASAQQLRVTYSDTQYDDLFWYERE